MSKAEEKSKQYREFREQCGIKDPVMLDEIEEAYFEGYNRAEKDLVAKACEYLNLHCDEVKTEDNGIAGWIDNEFIDNFRKAMRNEIQD